MEASVPGKSNDQLQHSLPRQVLQVFKGQTSCCMVVKPGPYLTSISTSCLLFTLLFKADLWHLIVRSHYKLCHLEAV